MSARSMSKPKPKPAKRVGGRKTPARAAGQAPRSLSSTPQLSNAKDYHPGRYKDYGRAIIDTYDAGKALWSAVGQPSWNDVRGMFKRVTGAVGTKSFPDAPPHPTSKLGPSDSPIFESLEPMSLPSGEVVGAAPAAISDTVSRYSEMAGNDRAMRVRFRQPWFHIGSNGTPVFPAAPILMSASSSSSGPTSPMYCNVITINPLRANWYAQSGTTVFNSGVAFSDGVTIADIALGFSMWRVCGPMTFHYEPQSSTASTARVDLAFTDDGAHPILGYSNIGNSAPTVTQIDATSTSVAFAPWNAWQLKVQPDTSWKYCYNSPYFATGVSSITSYNANMRTTSCGAVAAVVTGGSVGAIYGRVLLECEIEFKDPAPLAALSPLLSQNRIRSILAATYGDEAENDDPGEPVESKLERFSVTEPPDPTPTPTPPLPPVHSLTPASLVRASAARLVATSPLSRG